METTTSYPRLYGELLLCREEEYTLKGYTRAEMIISAGYKRPDGTPAYTAFYEAKIDALDRRLRKEVQAKAEQNPRYLSLIKAIRGDRNYQQGQYRVTPYGYSCCAFYYGRNLLLTVNFNEAKVTVFECEPSRPNKDRLNRVLMDLCGLKLFRKGREWKVVYPSSMLDDVPYTTGSTFDII